MVEMMPTKNWLVVLSLGTFATIFLNCNAYSTSTTSTHLNKLVTSAKKTTSKPKSHRAINQALFASSSSSGSSDTKVKSDDNTPFFARAFGNPGSLFSSTPASPKSKEGKAASITTRVPLGTLFDSREYTFETLTNVRGYEWTLKVAEELLDDFIDASRGYLGDIDLEKELLQKQDYELSQIVLVPMEWDTDRFGLGNRYDVFDGQQRLVSLCLMFAALRESFAKDDDMEDTVTELKNMLSPTKTRKDDIVRIELHKRDNKVLSHILKDEISELDSIKKDVKTLTRANRRIYENYQRFYSRISEMPLDERVKLLDFMVEDVHLLVCIPETNVIARNLVTAQGKGMDNEPIDDFKGLVCFRYTQDEKNMYKTFDSWDHLASTTDLDNGSVGRDTVSDACLLRATTVLRQKIRKRDILLSLERWLRRDVIQNKREGHIFFKKKIEPPSLTLGQYRNGDFHLFGFYSRSKDKKVWTSIAMRLHFLRSMTTTVASVRDVEMVVLDLLLRASGVEGKAMSLNELDQQLHGVEILSLWMALSKPTVSNRYQKCFEFLDAIENGEDVMSLISQQEKSMIREALVITEFGSNAAGKRIATYILKRINCHVHAQESNGDKNRVIESLADSYLELILPVKATKKTWGHTWPEKEEREKWVNRIGNFAIVSSKPTAAESKMPFVSKKERFQKEDDWPLTLGLTEIDEWDSNSLIKNLANIVNLIDKVWAL